VVFLRDCLCCDVQVLESMPRETVKMLRELLDEIEQDFV